MLLKTSKNLHFFQPYYAKFSNKNYIRTFTFTLQKNDENEETIDKKLKNDHKIS